ncbi:MAG TPA: alpha/beta hydrolase [Micromonosporaceae bacterium]|nr:alpha/beta hydrolase [Micromonosporaceae bacterium]
MVGRWPEDATGRLQTAALALFAERGYATSTTSPPPRSRRQAVIPTSSLELVDPRRQAWRGEQPRPVRVQLWSPAAVDAPPVVLLSHGTGGAARDLTWLAEPLAAAGFLVAGVDHHGNNSADDYIPEAFACIWDRPMDLSFVLDQLARMHHVGPVGVAGFSLGGYTAAALLGARIDPHVLAGLLHGHIPFPPTPEYPDLAGEIRARVDAAQQERWLSAAARDYADPRIRAGFLICPSVGLVLDPASLASIGKPSAVWWAEADDVAPPAENAQRYARLIPTATGRSAGTDVGHYAFLNRDPAGRPARDFVAADAVEFFRTTLGPDPEPTRNT